MYRENKVVVKVNQNPVTLQDRFTASIKHGMPMPDMATPDSLPLGNMPLMMENRRFVGPEDLYLASISSQRKISDVQEKLDNFFEKGV